VVCVYFCDDKIDQQKDARGILIGVIFQIISHYRSLIQHARKIPELQGASLIQLLAALWKLFLDLVGSPKSRTTYIILDGLGECEPKTRHKLLQFISELFEDPATTSSSSSHVKFIMTSRPALPELGTRTTDFVKSHIAIDAGIREYNEDIKRFIQERMEGIVGCPADLKTISYKSCCQGLIRLFSGSIWYSELWSQA
jgi:hypothetical protein